MTSTNDIDAYLARLGAGDRIVLQHLRETIAAAAPQAVEVIAYGMPAFRLAGRFLVSYAAYRRHCSLFPASGAIRAELGPAVTPYLAGRGTLRFTVDAPIPDDVVRRIVEVRVAEVTAGAGD